MKTTKTVWIRTPWNKRVEQTQAALNIALALSSVTYTVHKWYRVLGKCHIVKVNLGKNCNIVKLTVLNHRFFTFFFERLKGAHFWLHFFTCLVHCVYNNLMCAWSRWASCSSSIKLGGGSGQNSLSDALLLAVNLDSP